MRASTSIRVVGPPLLLSLLAAGSLLIGVTPATPKGGPRAPKDGPATPTSVAFSPDGTRIAATDNTGGRLWLVSTATLDARPVALRGSPQGVVWTQDGRLFAAESGAAGVVEIDPEAGAVKRRATVGRYPRGLAVAEERGLLLVANSGTHTVSVLDLATLTERTRVPVVREPQFIAVAADESLAVVGNLLPAGPATAPDQAAVVSLLDLTNLGERRDVKLPPGSISARGVAVARNGRFAYVVHTLGRINVPTTQLERGWVNTNALSIIDLASAELYATLLLDHPFDGAADPWGMALSPDDSELWITLSGVHQLARIDLLRLHTYLEGGLPESDPLAHTGSYSPETGSIWLRIRRDPGERAELVNDLAALYAADLIERTDLDALGPRGIAHDAGSGSLAIASHFTGEILLLNAGDGEAATKVLLGAPREPDQVRRGRRLFHDATLCFQRWLSCATCHPNEARVDGMNWDLQNDGIGNPKNLKSLLHADRTPPMMWRGVRADMESATREGLHFLLRVPEPGEVEALCAYIRSLEPEPSPYLGPNGELTPSAERGRRLMEQQERNCLTCHTGPLQTDLKLHDVGTRGTLDHAAEFDTPSLIELWRSAPYLHDGSAATLRELLTSRNIGDRHGVTSDLDEADLADLIAYLRSL